MSTLRIRLFGGLVVHRGETPLPRIPTHRARVLFAYLALHPHRDHHREVLCGVLWGEQAESEARKALRSALWRIRSVLEPGEEDRGRALRVEGERIAFPGRDESWVDVMAFEEGLARARGPDPPGTPGAIGALTGALGLYRGELLEGMYESWCCPERERLHLARLDALEELLLHHRVRGEWLPAIRAAREILRVDPLREHVHRALMAVHFQRGDRPSALRQYRACEGLVRAELGVEPLPETRALHQAIRERGALPPGEGVAQPSPSPSPPSPHHPGDAELREAVERLSALVLALDAARAPSLSSPPSRS